MDSYEIDTYSDLDKFKAENIKLGQCDSGCFGKFEISNIWICELYQNKITKEYVLFITRDNDEQWIVFKIA